MFITDAAEARRAGLWVFPSNAAGLHAEQATTV